VKRLLSLLAAAAVAVVAAGCGGSGSSDQAAKPTANDTLRIMGFGSGDEIATTRIAIARKAIAPAKLRNPPGSFQEQQFLTAIAGGDVPDLVYLDRQKVGTLAARGALRPLDDCISSQAIDMSQYRPAAVDEVTLDGKVYGIPEFFTNRTIIASDTVAKDAGVPVASISSTDWNRLAAVSRQLAVMQGGKPTRIGFDPKLPEFFPLWAKANGADLLSADGLHAQLDGPKAIEALRFAIGLVDAQGGWGKFKSFRDTWDFFGAGNEFAQGQVGAFPMEDWYYNVLAENSPDVRITAKPFTDRRGQPIDWASGSAWAIPTGAEHPGLACTWAKTMTAVDTWVAAAKARATAAKRAGTPFTGLYTANAKADDRIFDELYTPLSPQFDHAVKVVRQVQDDAFALPASPAGIAFKAAWTEAVNRVLAGQQSPAAALHRAQREAQRAIDDAS
jgi:multiple sugar transport system substrate-binding protein